MKTIGITGGVGAGKSVILAYLEKQYQAKVYYADEIAKKLQLPGESCYEQIVDLLSKDICNDEGFIVPQKMAAKMFADKQLVEKVNAIIHPAVKQYILSKIRLHKDKNDIDYFVLEAALLIEDHYNEILDEIWYIHTDPDVRRIRLKSSRHYSDEKIDQIMSHQLSVDEFKKYCKYTITNNDDVKVTYRQIDSILEEN